MSCRHQHAALLHLTSKSQGGSENPKSRFGRNNGTVEGKQVEVQEERSPVNGSESYPGIVIILVLNKGLCSPQQFRFAVWGIRVCYQVRSTQSIVCGKPEEGAGCLDYQKKVPM